MRWDRLVDDLSAQLDAELAADDRALVGDLTRAEQATVTLAARLAGARGSAVSVRACGGGDRGGAGAEAWAGSDLRVSGVVAAVAHDWVVLDVAGRGHLLPLAAVAVVEGLGPAAVDVPARPGASLAAVLRGVMRDRQAVEVRTGAAVLRGRVARVGRDHLDVEQVGLDGVRPTGSRASVAFSSLVCVNETVPGG
ncbi:hypothetical protein [Cellulomonas sp. PhB143]|uniref:hypothetical protein n=1 Tax=Cellulomonas sp. PhB143 TaxID=2485186 RepID=UPI000FB6E6A7|nr:hypothetical protein [Cellulomonas sp. PhB143]ROS78509.1 hypothetical protein EDF32_0406 [Cellulomonas sp. PhB143]